MKNPDCFEEDPCERIIEARRIMKTPEFKVLQSPTKKAIKYYEEQDEYDYPHLTVTEVCIAAGVNPRKYYDRLKHLREGTPTGVRGRPSLITPEEKEMVKKFVNDKSEERKCPTIDDVVEYVNSLRLKRLGSDKYKPVCKKTVSNMIKSAGLVVSKPMTAYEAKAISDQATIRQMYINIHGLMDAFQYPNWLIFNMDESWVSTEDKTSKRFVVHPENHPPVSYQPKVGCHITLIGCVAKSGDAVEESFVIPKALETQAKTEHNCLERVKLFINGSGFINGTIFARWIDEVLAPHINRLRQYPGQRALLIVDAHASRSNIMALQALQRNMIDMVVLPAHVTSKYQPLDVVVYGKFKEGLRADVGKNDNAGVYGFLFSARNAFRIATTPRSIRSAWERSKLFTDNPEAVISEHPVNGAPKRTRGTNNVVFLCAPLNPVNRV